MMIDRNFLELEKRYFTQRVEILNEKDYPLSFNEIALYLRYLRIDKDYDVIQKKVITLKELLNMYSLLAYYIKKRTPKSLQEFYNISYISGLGTLVYHNTYFNTYLKNYGLYYLFDIDLFQNELNQIDNRTTNWKKYKVNPTFAGFVLFLNHIFGETIKLKLDIMEKGSERMNEIMKEDVFIIPISKQYYKKYTYNGYDGEGYGRERNLLYEYSIDGKPFPMNYFIYEWYSKDGLFNITSDKKLYKKYFQNVLTAGK